MDNLTVSSEIVKGYLVVKLVGELGMFNSSVFTDCVEGDLLDGGINRVIIDAAGLKFIDSCGVGALVSVYKKVTPNGGFVYIVGAQAGLLETLTITRLTKLFPLFDTVEDAIVGSSGASEEIVGQVGGGTISSTIAHKFLVLKMSGNISEKEIPQAKEAFTKFGNVAALKGMILNVAELKGLDAAGMAFIQDIGAQVRWVGGRSILAGTPARIMRMMHKAEIEHQFEFFDNIMDVISDAAD